MFHSAAKSQSTSSNSAANTVYQNKQKNTLTVEMRDNRPKAIAERNLQTGIKDGAHIQQMKGFKRMQNNEVSANETGNAGTISEKGKSASVYNRQSASIQRKEAPIQRNSYLISTDAELENMYWKCYYKYYVNKIGTSKELKKILGGKGPNYIWWMVTDNRGLRDHLKESIRIKYENAIGENPILSEDNSYNKKIKHKTLDSVKEDKKRVLNSTIDNVLYSLSNIADQEFEHSFYQDKYKRGLKKESIKSPELEDWMEGDFNTRAEEWITSALKKIKDGKHPVYGTDVYEFMEDQISEIDFEEESTALIKDKIQENTVGDAMHSIGEKINAALQKHDVVKIGLSVVLPIINAGLAATAHILINFQGTATKKTSQKINANARLSIEAVANVLKLFKFSAGVGGYFQAEGGDTNELMRLFSYGAYKVVGGVSDRLADYLWSTDIETAKEWAAKRGADSLINDNYVEAAAFLNAGAGLDAVVYKKNIGIEKGKGVQYSKSYPDGASFSYTKLNKEKSERDAMQSYEVEKTKRSYLNSEYLNECSYQISAKVKDGIIGGKKFITKGGYQRFYQFQIVDWINNVINSEKIDNSDKSYIQEVTKKLADRIAEKLNAHDNFILQLSVNKGTKMQNAELIAKKDGLSLSGSVKLKYPKEQDKSKKDESRYNLKESINKTLIGEDGKRGVQAPKLGVDYSTQDIIASERTEEESMNEGSTANRPSKS
jgi:hypothetical protein